MPPRLTVQQTRRVILLLLAVVALVTAGGWFYARQRKSEHQVRLPAPLPAGTTQSEGFSLAKSEQGRTIFTVKAARAREHKDRHKSVLEEVEIVTYGAQGNRYDRISSKLAQYDSERGRVYSEGEVEIELASLPGETPAADAPESGTPTAPRTPIYVKTSGLWFEEKTGVAATDRLVEFRFSRGSGKAMGAVYDSTARTLTLKSAVEITARDNPQADPPEPPVEIKAAELVYRQREAVIELRQPQLQRTLPGGETRWLAGDQALLLLNAQNQVSQVHVQDNVRARQTAKDGESHLAADRVEMIFDSEQALESAHATGNVRLDSATSASRNEARAASLTLAFGGPEKELSHALFRGGVRMLLAPAGPKEKTDPVRILTSEAAEMFLKPGGSEVGTAQTLAPGRLEMIPPPEPPRPNEPPRTREGRRVLTAEWLWMEFGEENRVRVLKAERRVRFVTELLPPAGAPPPPSKKPRPTERVTTSDTLDALFATGAQEIEAVEQKGNFRYVEGEQQATAERAFYTGADERLELTGRPGRNPEVRDAATRTTAVKITLDRKNNEGVAEQQVFSVHVAEECSTGILACASRPDCSSVDRQECLSHPGPLSDKDPVHVAAERMLTNSKTGVTRYEGAPGRRVRMWQNQDVIQARTLILERQERRMTAQGEVTTLLVETESVAPDAKGAAKPAAPGGSTAAGEPTAAGSGQRAASGQAWRPTPLVISAENFVYTDHDRRAQYERKVTLRRTSLDGSSTTMTSAALDAYLLAPEEVKPGQSRLDRAVARGSVQIVETSPTFRRRAVAELAEYAGSDERVVLTGGEPYVYDEQRGYTRGKQLTYHLHDDTIFVHGDRGSRTVTEHRARPRP